MRYPLRRTFGLLAGIWLLVSVLALTPPAGAKSYHFTRVDIEATILSNGDLRIVENRTASFSGSFSELWYEIDTTGSDGVAELAVYDSGNKLVESASETPGTYRTERKGKTVTVRVYFDVVNEARTFTFEYTLKNAVIVHRDTAELYWKFIGDGWDVPTDQVRIEVFYPTGVSRDDVRVWGHGPLHGEVTLTSTPSMLLTVEHLEPNRFVEGRTTFPTWTVPGARRITNRDALDDILAEEADAAEKANELRDLMRRQLASGKTVDLTYYERQLELTRQPGWVRWLVANHLAIGVAICAVAAAIYLSLHFKYGREYKPEFEGDYYRELPADYSPAVLGVLWRFGSPNTEDFTAEIMNLARRGYLRIVEKRTERKRAFGLLGTQLDVDYVIEKTPKLEDESALLPYERELVNLLFTLGSRQSVSFDDIIEYAKKYSHVFAKRFDEWKAAVSAYAERYDFFDRNVGKGRAIGVLAAVCVIAIGCLLLAVGARYGAFGGIFWLCSGGFLLVMSAVMNRRSRSGATEFCKWKAFRRFLTDFSSLDRATIPSLAIWEHYLVYAVTLGVAKEVIKQLPVVFPELNDDPSRFARTWLVISTLDSTPARALDSLNNLTSAMNQVMAQAIAKSPASSGAGRGGGFSAGGGVGGGGTGGGAR